MTFSADHLPEGVALDADTGRLSGSISKPGTYPVTVTATNALGSATDSSNLVVGNTIALTPPLGWSSWNVWGPSVNQIKVQEAVDGLISTGLAQHGYTYVNIDDTWQGVRSGSTLALQPDPVRFPDIQGLSNHIHDLGLKFGLYSTPWKVSYDLRPGSSADHADGTNDNQDFTYGAYSFVQQDANEWTKWGMDYLKYDWAPIDGPHTQPMSAALQEQQRDIVFSLSNTAPIKNAGDFTPLANLWRTSQDLMDDWLSLRINGFLSYPWQKWQSPGNWNDEDMLVLGTLGMGFGEKEIHPTRLTPNEQYTHMSLWSLLGSPLILGCDLTKLDKFTLSLITNDEVLAIDQDVLGIMASRIRKDVVDQEVWAKPLADGSVAVGLFNLDGWAEHDMTIHWKELGISGEQVVRDVWRQQDIGTLKDSFTATVPIHGVVLLKISPAR
jgi:alpha-galactosidase